GIRPAGSGTAKPSAATRRRSWGLAAERPHPTHRRCGSAGRGRTLGRLLGGRGGADDLVGAGALEGLVGLEAAVAGAGERGVGAAAAGRHDGGAATLDVLLLVAVLGLLGGELGLGLDVDPP